jgi:hypothetical protein
VRSRWPSAAAAVGILAASWIAAGGAAGRVDFTPCRISQLRLALREPLTEKTQQHTTALSVRNVSSRSCALAGYPTLALLDRSGRELPFSYRHDGDQMVTAARPNVVRLAPRSSAFFAFNKNVCVGFTHRYGETLRVIVPAGQRSRRVELGSRAVDYCGRADPGHVVTVSPIEAHFLGVLCLSQTSCRRR